MTLNMIVDFLHLLATVTWIGGMIYANLVLMPSLPSIEPSQRGNLLGAVTRRFMIVAWGSVIVLIVTGIIKALTEDLEQLSATTQLALKVKYGLFTVMLVVGILISFVLAPKMKAVAPEPGTKPSPQFLKIQHQIATLSLVNMILAILILILVSI